MRYFQVLFVFLALGSSSASATTVPVLGQGVSITIPDNWVLLKRPNTALVASSPGEDMALGIIISTHGGDEQADAPDSIRGMVQAILDRAKSGGSTVKVIDAGPRTINGVPAGFVQIEQTFPDHRAITSRAYNMAANGKSYLLTLETRDPRQDPVLEKIADSFRFDRPPQLLGPNDFIVHRLGEIGGILLLVGVAVFLARAGYQRYKNRKRDLASR